MARVLARVARPEDAEAMLSLLKDPSAVVRRLAIEGLAGSGSEPVAEQLRLALGDESPTVRMAAAAALGESTGDAVLADLERALRDEDPRVAASAARAIGRHGEARSLRAEAVSLLAAALAGEGLVGMAALEALEHVGGQEAATAASAVLGRSEPELLQAAVRCIGRHGDAASLAALIPIVQHESWAVRSLAIETLAERRVARALPAILRRLEREQDGFVRDAITRALRVLEESATR